MKKLSDCRVLIVDDAKANLDILVEGLKADHKLSLALNGEMALQAAARNPPDLVLLDIVMPGLDGYEVCRRLRQMPSTVNDATGGQYRCKKCSLQSDGVFYAHKVMCLR